MKKIPVCCFCAAAAVLCATASAAAKVTGKPHTLEDIQALGFKTVNGQSIVGTGDIAIPGADDYKSAVSVADFGAAGDGATDDTAAVAAAAAAARTAGKPLYFPRTDAGSTYLVSAPLALGDGMAVSSALGVTLKSSAGDALLVTGAGVNIRNITVAAQNGCGIVINGASGVRINDVIVSDADKDGITVSRATNVWIVGTIVKKADEKGIRLAAGAYAVSIRGCLVTGCEDGIFFDESAAGAVIVGNQLDCTASGLAGYGWHEGADNTDAIIANNTFCVGGVNLTGGSRLSLTGNCFLRIAGTTTALSIAGDEQHPLRDSVIADNTFGSFAERYSNPNGALIVSGVEKVIIRGNVLRCKMQNGNAVIGGGKVDIVVSNSRKVMVTANVVDGDINVSTGNEGLVLDGNVTIGPEPEPESTPES